jgi:1-deoxy-D-xylulose-5-phosphate synthase
LELLKQLNNPVDLRELKIRQLPEVCRELREFIIKVMSKQPGHFGASLGTVELTVALHYAFNTPEDKLVWDVGHQAYAHKILTERKDKFDTLRKFKGISGFPNIHESIFDTISVGHSSTSISASLGIAVSKALQNDKHQAIAVIGDGALTGGMAYEALNNAGITKSNIIIVLNDNNMSIDPNVVAINKYLTKVSSSKTYNTIKDRTWNMLGGKLSPLRRIFAKFGTGMKSTIQHEGNLFESLGIRYFGPVDGHDVEGLVRRFNDLKEIEGPKILHCVTKKGKGFLPAEKDQTIWHAPGLFDCETGERVKTKSNSLKYQDVFGKTLLELARKDERIVGVSPAMISGSSLNIMQKEFPDRVFDVGIAEQHAVTFSAGLAIQGTKPVCVIYSTFLQRAYDQLIHDVALQGINMTVCIDRGGLVGEDGETHQGAFDLAFLRLIPDTTIAVPMNGIELRNMLYTSLNSDNGLVCIRYPRGENGIKELDQEFELVPIGKAEKLIEGDDVAVLTVGKPGNFVAEVVEKAKAKNISVAHYNMRFVKPLDTETLDEVFTKFNKIITVEDGTVVGGFGSAVSDYMVESGARVDKLVKLGIPDKFIEHGKVDELYKLCGFDADAILEAVVEGE